MTDNCFEHSPYENSSPPWRHGDLFATPSSPVLVKDTWFAIREIVVNVP